MPCYSVQTTKVAMGKVDLERMARAARAEGWTVIQNDNNKLTLAKDGIAATFQRGREEVQLRGGTTEAAATLKRAYAAQTAIDAARKHGWKLKNQSAEGSTIKLKIGR